MQKAYNVVMNEYKAVLKDWYKGTGGGSGKVSMFQDWTKEYYRKWKGSWRKVFKKHDRKGRK